MGFLTFVPIIGKVLDDLLHIVDKSTEDKDKANELKATLKQAVLTLDLQKYDTQIQAQVKTILAEEQGKSWMQRNWRPALMFLFGLIIFNNYIFAPYIQLLVGVDKAITLPIPPDMWGLLKLGVSGYIVGRSGEKIFRTIHDNKTARETQKMQNDSSDGIR